MHRNGSDSTKLWKKADGLLILLILMVAVLAVGWQYLKGKQGEQAVVTVDGILYGSYSLEQDRQIQIESDDGANRNVLRISDGTAWMEEADCPDKICVEHKPIHRVGESIVCLPHKVVVEIKNSDGVSKDSEVDVIVK